ncbi:gliding motility-associated ABC transporter permease subunit GldF [Aureisphaera galaxeae]|uniref:gliding motility-associated ABC transporter permease subunit GldF n=1 Tax=Aureisphaera galaxeae TaxID=1538023 RepID=UPI00234FCD6D|nr:gliding motility-associated ABC transporter permease subunit GldF [Aureisphaera galaxeae]MDC8004539.1 gliding motility-associated ABC transporter permease subunit GldF [Aureisphaera galaxeae]
MIALIKKEISSFFSSPIGYLVIALFLVFNGLFLWVFGGNYNVFDAGFADLSPFFELAPWILLFLIPAVTMRSFSEETKLGTLELLLTKPLGLRNIILGKYFGALLLIVIAIVPTLAYILTISNLGNPSGNWDVGSTLGSYLGLLFLAIGYTSIGIFASSLSKNQIVAFIIAVFLCFVLYFGFEGLSSDGSGSNIAYFGMESHFKSMSRGVIDTRDVIYFLSVAFLFLTGTYIKLKKES